VVFAALALSKHLFDVDLVLRAFCAFLVFCGLSGAVYLINDVTDVEKDRLHPLKRLRPIAAGQLGVPAALTWAAVLAAGCLAAAALIGPWFGAASFSYLLVNLAYSLRLKEIVILDALAVSLGFVLRAYAGGLAIRVEVSDWLVVCILLLALFLALAKRRHELVTLSDQAREHRAILAEYSPYLLDQMIGVVSASCVTAYAFYTLSPETHEKYKTSALAWTIPFVIYGVFRYLYLVHQREQGGSPTDILITDRPLLITVALWALTIVAIVYAAPGAPMPVGR
jgi:4-hydroxybenzoate polyprenyltransferase